MKQFYWWSFQPCWNKQVGSPSGDESAYLGAKNLTYCWWLEESCPTYNWFAGCLNSEPSTATSNLKWHQNTSTAMLSKCSQRIYLYIQSSKRSLYGTGTTGKDKENITFVDSVNEIWINRCQQPNIGPSKICSFHHQISTAYTAVG